MNNAPEKPAVPSPPLVLRMWQFIAGPFVNLWCQVMLRMTYHSARLAAIRKDHVEAERQLRRCLDYVSGRDRVPRAVGIRTELATVLESLGRRQDARKEMDRAEQIARDAGRDDLLRLVQGTLDFQEGRSEAAIGHFEAFLLAAPASDPSVPSARFTLALSLLLTGKVERAGQEFQRVAKVYEAVGNERGVQRVRLFESLLAIHRGELTDLPRLMRIGVALGQGLGWRFSAGLVSAYGSRLLKALNAAPEIPERVHGDFLLHFASLEAEQAAEIARRLGAAFEAHQEYSRAKLWLLKSMEAAREAKNVDLEVKARAEYGNLLFRSGRLKDSLECFEEIEKGFEPTAEHISISCFGQLQALIRLGHYERAEGICVRIETLGAASIGEEDLGEFILALARSTLDWRLSRSTRRLGDRAANIATKWVQSSDPMKCGMGSMMLGFHAKAAGTPDGLRRAIEHAKTAIAQFPEVRQANYKNNASLLLIECLFEAGDFLQVLDVAPTMDQCPNLHQRGSAASFAARALLMLDRPQMAMATYRRACEALDLAEAPWHVIGLATWFSSQFLERREAGAAWEAHRVASRRLDLLLNANKTPQTLSRLAEAFAQLQEIAINVSVDEAALLHEALLWIEARRAMTMLWVSDAPATPAGVS